MPAQDPSSWFSCSGQHLLDEPQHDVMAAALRYFAILTLGPLLSDQCAVEVKLMADATGCLWLVSRTEGLTASLILDGRTQARDRAVHRTTTGAFTLFVL